MMKLTMRFALVCALPFFGAGSARAQAPPAGPPPSIANEPPPEPGADELNTAARKGDLAGVKALLDKGISPDAKWRYGMTALFPACDRGHIEIVRLLLDHGANANARDRFYNATPITWALNKGHAEIAILLLEKGATNTEQILTTAIDRDSVALARAALAKGGLQPVGLTGALLRATRANKNEMVEILKGAGAQPAFAVDAGALTAYAGTYRSENTTLNFVVKEGALEGGVVGPQPPLHLFATDEVTFRAIERTALILTFAKDGSEVSVLQGTQTTKYKREVKQ